MGVDLFGALGLDRSCTQLDVKRAFRRAALRLHPDRARLHTPVHLAPIDGLHLEGERPRLSRADAKHGEKGGSIACTEESRRFALAARAYEVLVDPESRAQYEVHGDVHLPPFHGDPQRTFRKFFGTDNPFLAQLRDRVHFDVEKPEPPETVEVPLRVSLQEVNEGATKTCTVAVRVPAATPGGDTDATTLRERSFAVEVQPGAPTRARYEFRRQGHQDAGRPPGDVVLVLEELPHDRFHREGADLVQREAVSLRQALTGCTVEILTLDDRRIRVAITDIVSPGYEKRLPGEGLPVCGSRGSRGDLVLRLDIRFPSALSRPCRALLDQALQLDEADEKRALGAGGGLCRAGAAAAAGGVARAILEEKMRRQTK